jgi:hypothetical protein
MCFQPCRVNPSLASCHGFESSVGWRPAVGVFAAAGPLSQRARQGLGTGLAGEAAAGIAEQAARTGQAQRAAAVADGDAHLTDRQVPRGLLQLLLVIFNGC